MIAQLRPLLGVLLLLVLVLGAPAADCAPANDHAAGGTCSSHQGPVLDCASCGGSQFRAPGACIANGAAVEPTRSRCCADAEAVALLQRLLQVLQHEAFDATARAVEQGDSPFGAAVLQNDAPGYPLLVAAANAVRTSHNPTAHGEMEAIAAYFQQQRLRQQHQQPTVAPADTIFLATHQPCSLCLSGLAFSGFRRIYYGFDFAQSMNDGEAAGSILDVAVMEQVFGTRCGRVDHTNGMFTLVPVRGMLAMRPCNSSSAGGALGAALQAAREQYEAIVDAYAALGEAFQARMAQRAASGAGASEVQLMAAACHGCKPFPRKECGAEFM